MWRVWLVIVCLSLPATVHAQVMVDILENKCANGHRDMRVWLWSQTGGAIGTANYSLRCDGIEEHYFVSTGLGLNNNHLNAIRAVSGGKCADCSNAQPPCPPVNTALIGLNCCAAGESGATYFLTTNSYGCQVLACAADSCHADCPPPPSQSEGSSCACDGGGSGTITYEYDSNGCPNGAVCDGCLDCDPVEQGLPCMCEDGSSGQTSQGPDDSEGCPTQFCDCLGADCSTDSDMDGIPDSQEDNPYAGKQAGDRCTCEGGERDGSTIVIDYDDDGCPQPRCQCECEDKGGDSDGDGCCDDEDPDPDDESVGCEDCEQEIAKKLEDLVTLFRSKVGFTSPESIAPSALSFTVDTTGSLPGIVNFPLRFGGDFSTLKFWYGHPENTQGRGLPPTVFDNLALVRATIRGALAVLILVLFWRAMLKALFSPHR